MNRKLRAYLDRENKKLSNINMLGDKNNYEFEFRKWIIKNKNTCTNTVVHKIYTNRV